MSEKNVQTGGDLEGVLAQVSNQLRSSLGNIYNALSRIAPPELRDGDTGIDRDAAVLCQSYYRILRLANNLSDAANLEGPSTAKLCNGDLVGLCRDVMRRAELPAQLLGIQLSFQCGKASHIVAMDGERLECLLLSDTGSGIAPELLETVFDRYLHTRRLDPPPHGLGLGLPICRRIAQEHGGSLVLTSTVGVGTTVTVSLPNRKLREQALGTFQTELGGGFNQTLVELADALPREAFTQKYMD